LKIGLTDLRLMGNPIYSHNILKGTDNY